MKRKLLKPQKRAKHIETDLARESDISLDSGPGKQSHAAPDTRDVTVGHATSGSSQVTRSGDLTSLDSRNGSAQPTNGENLTSTDKKNASRQKTSENPASLDSKNGSRQHTSSVEGNSFGSNEDLITDNVKKETVHGFIIDQWYDLGPHVPEEDYDLPTENIKLNDVKDCSTLHQSAANAQNVTPESRQSKCGNIKNSKILQSCPKTNPDQSKKSVRKKHKPTNGMSNKDTRSLLTTPGLVNILPQVKDASAEQLFQPESLRLRLAYPSLRSDPETIMTNPHEAGTGTERHDINCSAVVTQADGISGKKCRQRNADSGSKKLMKESVDSGHKPVNVRKLRVCKSEAPTTSPGNLPISGVKPVQPQLISMPCSVVTSGFIPQGFLGGSGYLTYPSQVNPYNFIQSSPVPSPGVVFVSSQPCFIQQMPFMSVLPHVNYSQVQTNVLLPLPSVDNSVTAPLGNSQVTNSDAMTTKSTSLPNTFTNTTTRISAPVDESSRPHPEFRLETEKNLPLLQSSRLQSKPKVAVSSDFVDPTRMKFGVDDSDDEEDLSKTNDFSDCSDQEWQPTKRDCKSGGCRDTDEWMSQEDDNTDTDSPVKKTSIKRRKKSAKESTECSVCGKVFQGVYYLRRHQLSHNDIRPYKCETCEKSFKQKAHLIGHRGIHERSEKKQLADSKNSTRKSQPFMVGYKCSGRPKKMYNEKELACKECSKTFRTVYRLKRHELSHTDARPFSCRICGKGFKQTGHRNEHEANHEDTKKRFLCCICGVVFRCRSSFNNHMRSHGSERHRLEEAKTEEASCHTKIGQGDIGHTGYDCPYCIEKFATAQALNSHLETHVEVQQRRHVQPYACDICKRSFTYRHNLLKHKLIHGAPDKFSHFYKEKLEAHVSSGKPSYSCTVCAKVFIRKETLAKHSKVHSGNKPFKCEICSHDFTQNVHLKVHMRKHTGSRPFQCNECARSFIDSTALAKHIEYEACNTDNSLYHCKICDKLHYYLGSIKQHLKKMHAIEEVNVNSYILKSERTHKRKSVSGEGRYPCLVCSSNFSEKCNLVRHVRRKHPGLVELLQKEQEVKKGTNSSHNRNKCESDEYYCCNEKFEHALLEKCEQPDVDMASCKDIAVDHERAMDGSSKQFLTDHRAYEINLRPVPRGSNEDMGRGTAFGNDSQVTEQASDITASCCGLHVIERRDGQVTLQSAEENDQQYLEGFPRSGFRGSDRQFSHNCSCESFVASEDCSVEKVCRCSGYCKDSVSSFRFLSESRYHSERGLEASVNKDSAEDESSSPTDINFLYNIGLIVSSKGKTCRDLATAARSRLGSQDSDLSDEVFMSPGESLDEGWNSHSYENVMLCNRGQIFRKAEGMKANDKSVTGKDSVEASRTTDFVKLRKESKQDHSHCPFTEYKTPHHDLWSPEQGGLMCKQEKSNLDVAENDTKQLQSSSKCDKDIQNNCRSYPVKNVASDEGRRCSSRDDTNNEVLRSETEDRCVKGSESTADVLREDAMDVSAADNSREVQPIGGLIKDDTEDQTSPIKNSNPPNLCRIMVDTEASRLQSVDEIIPSSESADTRGQNPSFSRALSSSAIERTQDSSRARINLQPRRKSEQEVTITTQKTRHSADLVKPWPTKLEENEEKISEETKEQHKDDGHQLQQACRDAETDQVMSDLEAGLTESQIKHLGLLACKDARQIRNGTLPLETLYETYKPWLEDLVRRSRPKRVKIHMGALSSEPKPNIVDNHTIAPTSQEFITLSQPTEQNDANTDDNKSDTPELVIDRPQTPLNEPCIFNKKRKSRNKRYKSLTERDGSGQEGRAKSEQEMPTASPEPGSSDLPKETESFRYLSSSAISISTANPHAKESLSKSLKPDTAVTTDKDLVPRAAGSDPRSQTPECGVTGKQQFSCSVCKKTFTARHQLKRHELTHTDQRPYNCDKCGRAFRQKVHLSDHTKRHQGQRPFVCAGCGKRFVLKNEMNQHIKNHCRGSLDILKSTAVGSVIPTCELSCPASSGEVPPLVKLESPLVMMCGESYRAGDIISNGSIMLKVIESAEAAVKLEAHEQSPTPTEQASDSSAEAGFEPGHIDSSLDHKCGGYLSSDAPERAGACVIMAEVESRNETCPILAPSSSSILAPSSIMAPISSILAPSSSVLNTSSSILPPSSSVLAPTLHPYTPSLLAPLSSPGFNSCTHSVVSPSSSSVMDLSAFGSSTSLVMGAHVFPMAPRTLPETPEANAPGSHSPTKFPKLEL